MLRAQAPDDAREETLGSAHRLKREMRAVVSDTGPDAARLGAKECAQVDVGQDEFDLFDLPVETRARRGKESRAAARFVPRDREKTGKKRERDEDKSEIPHGD